MLLQPIALHCRELVLALGCLCVVLLGCASPGKGQASPQPQASNAGFGVSLSTDKAAYEPGKLVHITLVVFNHTEQPLSLQFNSSQRYDFKIEDEQGREIWRWSADKAFAMAIVQETLGPQNPRLVYKEICSEKLEPGTYTVSGGLTATRPTLFATTGFVVR